MTTFISVEQNMDHLSFLKIAVDEAYKGMRSDAEKIGFMDAHLYREISLKEEQREINISRISVPEMEALMEEWMSLDGKNLY